VIRGDVSKDVLRGDFTPAGVTKGLSDRPLETFGGYLLHCLHLQQAALSSVTLETFGGNILSWCLAMKLVKGKFAKWRDVLPGKPMREILFESIHSMLNPK